MIDPLSIAIAGRAAVLGLECPVEEPRPQPSPRMVAKRESAQAPVRATLPLFAPLSPREEEVLALLTAGLTDRAIAAVLRISPRTVTTHVGSIYNKLGTSSRVVAATFAVRYGLAECAI